jgi:hypothetical protein
MEWMEMGEAPFGTSPIREAILAVDYSQFTRAAIPRLIDPER